MTHGEFEAEPVDAVRWMLEIDRIYAEARERNRAKPPTDETGLM